MNWKIEYMTNDDVVIHEVGDTKIVFSFLTEETRIISNNKVLSTFHNISLKDHYQIVVNTIAQVQGRALNQKPCL